MKKDYHITKACLMEAIRRDYYEAEFIYSLVVSEGDMLDHLLRGAKGGCVEAQVFIGLKLIYGIGCEKKLDEGLRWLKSAAYQNNPLALELLNEFYSRGFVSDMNDISIDDEALDFKNRLQSLSSANHEDISPLWDETIRLLRSPHESVINECGTFVLNIYARYTEEATLNSYGNILSKYVIFNYIFFKTKKVVLYQH